MFRFMHKHFILAFVIFLLINTSLSAQTLQTKQHSIQQKLAELEASAGGRLGISAIDTTNNRRIQYRADERFPFCSTAKVIAVSAILQQSMTDRHLLEQKITYQQNEVASSGYAPITSKHVATGMTISELCAAAIEYSDNGAMNQLIKKLGGTDSVTAFARFIGDKAFRLDRCEPALNSAAPGDSRDTTTPNAMVKSLQRLVIGNVLAASQRQQLQAWLKNNTTGNARIRAGVPKGWIVADKTGTGKYGTTNDIAIIWPPNCPPIAVAIYYTQDNKDAQPLDNVSESVMLL